MHGNCERQEDCITEDPCWESYRWNENIQYFERDHSNFNGTYSQPNFYRKTIPESTCTKPSETSVTVSLIKWICLWLIKSDTNYKNFFKSDINYINYFKGWSGLSWKREESFERVAMKARTQERGMERGMEI